MLREQTLYRTRPDVASDGRRFVYSSTSGAADQFNNLYVQPTAGGEPYKITFFQHDVFHPRWSPDDEWIAFITNEGGLPQLALLETHGGALRTVTIERRRWKRPMGILSVTTRDAATGAPTGSRIHLTASDGKFYAPADAYARVGGQGDHVFHHTGRFTVEVPAGQTALTVVKGFEYRPEEVSVEVGAGEVAELTVDLRRLTDMAAKGWYSGSTHVHMNYGGNLHNTLENLVMMSAAEDQDVVNEQVANKDNRILDHQFFVPGGGPHPASTPEHLVVVGQEYRPPFYGHVFMFGMRDHLLSPFTMGYEGTAIESLYPSNTDMFRKAKAQGATVGYVHAFGGEADPLDGNLGGGKGFLVDAALGTTDGIEWSDAARAGFFPVYAAWNNGLRVTATGGEDSISNLHRSKIVGSVRTYVHTGNRGLDMDAWFEGLREGRAFVSSGPLVELTANGRMAGETIALPAGGGAVALAGRVDSITPLERVFVVCRGEERADVPLSGDRRSAAFEIDLEIDRSGWCHLRAEGHPSERAPLDVRYAQAFTNPIWITVGEQPVRDAASAEYGMRWIDQAAGDGGSVARLAVRPRTRARVRAVRRGAGDLRGVRRRGAVGPTRAGSSRLLNHRAWSATAPGGPATRAIRHRCCYDSHTIAGVASDTHAVRRPVNPETETVTDLLITAQAAPPHHDRVANRGFRRRLGDRHPARRDRHSVRSRGVLPAPRAQEQRRGAPGAHRRRQDGRIGRQEAAGGPGPYRGRAQRARQSALAPGNRLGRAGSRGSGEGCRNCTPAARRGLTELATGGPLKRQP